MFRLRMAVCGTARRSIPICRSLLAACMLLTAWMCLALEPFSHTYSSTFAGLGVKAERSLVKLDDETWELRMIAQNVIAGYQEASRFRLNEQGYPIPLEHHFSSRLLGVDRSEITRFDWEAGRATWQRNEDVREAELEPRTLDRLLYQLLIPGDAQAGLESVSYRFVSRGRLKTYQFELVDTEVLRIGDSELHTLEYRRVDDKEEKETIIWLAPELGYELVKIQHHDEDGADYSMLLSYP